jgi:transposase InsO family protein
VPLEVKEYIFKYCGLHKGVRKECIKPELDRFCYENGFKKISVSATGQLKDEGKIESRKELSLKAKSDKIKEIKKTVKDKERRRNLQAKEPGDIVQIDRVHLNENGIKRYFITAIDVYGRQAYAKEYKTLSSDNAKDFMTKLRSRFAYKIKSVHTDNGLEFYKRLDDYLFWYNTQKVHQGLNWLTPFDFTRQFLKSVA